MAAKYDAYVLQFIGYSEDELAVVWGKSNITTVENGTGYITFIKTGETTVMVAPAIYQPYFDGRNVRHRIVQPERWERVATSCQTTFELDEGYVVAGFF